MVMPITLSPGKQLLDGDQMNTALAYPIESYASGIVAKAGGGQASATQLTESISSVDTVATAADSVKLPPAMPGLLFTVLNTAANSMQVFGTGSDTIDGAAAAAGVAQAGGKSAIYACAKQGFWRRVLSA